MEPPRRTRLARILAGLALAALAVAPGCQVSPRTLVPIEDIQITKQNANPGFDFLAYLYLSFAPIFRPPQPLTCSSVDVYLAWRTADFDAPAHSGAGYPFPAAYVWQVWRDVPRDAADRCAWREEVDFHRREGSASPRVVWVKITPHNDPNTTLDEEWIQD